MRNLVNSFRNTSSSTSSAMLKSWVGNVLQVMVIHIGALTAQQVLYLRWSFIFERKFYIWEEGLLYLKWIIFEMNYYYIWNEVLYMQSSVLYTWNIFCWHGFDINILCYLYFVHCTQLSCAIVLFNPLSGSTGAPPDKMPLDTVK